MAHRLGRRADDVRQRGQDRLDDGRLVELLVGVGPHGQRLRFGLTLGQHDLRLGATLEPRGLGVGLGGRDAGALLAFGPRDHRLGLGGRGFDRRGQQLLFLAVGLQLRELGLLAHDLLGGLGLRERPGLVGARLRSGHLCLGLGLSQRDVSRSVDLDLLSMRASRSTVARFCWPSKPM